MTKSIQPNELNNLIIQNVPLFILDVRNESDFKDWKIEGGTCLQYLNIPYFELLDGVDGILDQLPTDKQVVVTCAKEGSSLMVAELLREKSIEANYLKGGMKSWSEFLYPVKVYEDEKISVHQFIRVGKGCLSYLVVSGQEALVIDPSRFIDYYIDFAASQYVKIKHIADSHLHADHITGGRDLADHTGADYYLMKSEGAVIDFEPLEKYDKIEFADVKLEVLAVKTPGHTPGSVSFFINDRLLFSGDTIFVTGLGRPDLGGKAREWATELYNTIYNRVSHIADDVIVLPGHYADYKSEVNPEGFIGNTLGNIRQMNAIMEGQTKEDFVDYVASSASSETPPNFEDIVAINRGVKTASLDQKQELEIGPNRCAVHHAH